MKCVEEEMRCWGVGIEPWKTLLAASFWRRTPGAVFLVVIIPPLDILLDLPSCSYLGEKVVCCSKLTTMKY